MQLKNGMNRMIEVLKLLGFEGVKVNWSLSSCQGDGVSFTADTMYSDDIVKFLRMVSDNKANEQGYKLLESIVNKLHELWIKTNGFINPQIIRDYDYMIQFNRIQWNYVHSNSVQLVQDYTEMDEAETPEQVIKYFNNTEEFLKVAYLIICKDLEKYGYKCFEYRMPEDEFQELAECNQYEFTENGTIV